MELKSSEQACSANPTFLSLECVGILYA